MTDDTDNIDNLPLAEQFRIISGSWVDAEAAAALLEDTKSAVLSQKMLAVATTAGSVSRAEMQVKASDDWIDHLHGINAARKKANLLKVRREYLKMKFSEWVSSAADERARAGL